MRAALPWGCMLKGAAPAKLSQSGDVAVYLSLSLESLVLVLIPCLGFPISKMKLIEEGGGGGLLPPWTEHSCLLDPRS